MKTARELPDLELACMRILWEDGELTVKDVRERLHPHRPLAYTTIMTVLDRLARKGAVSRRKAGRAHLYRHAIPREEARQRALHRFLDNYFDGSSDSLRTYLSDQPLKAGGTPALPGPQSLDESLL